MTLLPPLSVGFFQLIQILIKQNDVKTIERLLTKYLCAPRDIAEALIVKKYEKLGRYDYYCFYLLITITVQIVMTFSIK